MKSDRRIKVKVKQLTGATIVVDVVPDMGIHEIKNLVGYKLGYSAEFFTLRYQGKILKLHRTLADYLAPEAAEVNVLLILSLGHREIKPTIGLDAKAVHEYMKNLRESTWCCWTDNKRNVVFISVIQDGVLNHYPGMDLNELDLSSYTADREVDGSEVIAANAKPVTRMENDALSEEVRSYAREIAKSTKNTDILAELQLTEAEKEKLENQMPNHIDSVTYEIINIPVKFVAEKKNHFIYELSILVNLPVNADGSRTIPNTTLPFHLRDIIPAREAYAHIQNKLGQLKAWRPAALESPANQAPAATIFRRLDSSPSIKDIKKFVFN